MKQHNEQKGFTIIEVVLVLAIAALIFLVVFLAVPALQRSQRDTQRRADIGRLHTAITNYSGNHQGTLPPMADAAAATAFVTKYLKTAGDKWEDPKTGAYEVIPGAADLTETTFTDGVSTKVRYAEGKKCKIDGTLEAGSGRQFAVQVILENNDLYCENN